MIDRGHRDRRSFLGRDFVQTFGRGFVGKIGRRAFLDSIGNCTRNCGRDFLGDSLAGTAIFHGSLDRAWICSGVGSLKTAQLLTHAAQRIFSDLFSANASGFGVLIDRANGSRSSSLLDSGQDGLALRTTQKLLGRTAPDKQQKNASSVIVQ